MKTCENMTTFLIMISTIISYACCYLQFDPKIAEPLIKECETVKLWTDPPLRNNIIIDLDIEFASVAEVTPQKIAVQGNSSWDLRVCARDPGLTAVLAKINGSSLLENEGVLHVIVGKFGFLKVVSVLAGWIYCCACAFSFYPQMYENYTRKSVIGLNLDYCILNVVGFSTYFICNTCMLYLSPLEKEYFRRHPTGLNPIQLSDIYVSGHGALAAAVTLYQCYIYDRGNQCITKVAKLILLIFASNVLISGIAVYMDAIHWLDFFYNCSYIKLSVTVIKYIPQAVMNFRRKSTVGWSIFNVILDFNGGFFTLFQMFVMAYNYDDWQEIWGAPTKFGLGLSTVIFDSLFVYQHFILYRGERQIEKK